MFRSALFLYVLVVAGLIAVNVSEAAGPLAARDIPAFLKARVGVGRSAVFHGKRQSTSIPDVPPQCQSTCDPVNTVLAGNTCAPSTCCQASFEMGYFNCFTCILGLINFTDFSQPQQLIDTLIDDCATEGIALPKLTFPGQNPNRALSSVASTKAATSAPLSLPQSSISISSQPTSAIQQSTITAVPTSSSSTLVQSTITGPPTALSSTGAAATPTTTSRGVKAADSRLALGMATALLGACFYFAL